MDSYQKYTRDMLAGYNWHFHRVKQQDLDEVQVSFAMMLSDLEYTDNFRIYPLYQKQEFYEQAEKGCCGSINRYVKCKSGRIYLIGCNYGH